MNTIDILRESNFGQRVAEEEINELASYFVQTEQWRKLYSGEIDIVYGPKGSGKSALYLLLTQRQYDLLDKGVLLVPAEEPRGQPAFRNVEADPPTSEPEFVGLWKLYFLTLVDACIQDFRFANAQANELHKTLLEAGLAAPGKGLAQILRNVIAYARAYFRKPSSVEGSVEIDPLTGVPKGFSGKITFVEPTGAIASHAVSVDRLLAVANECLGQAKTTVWLVLDRLDVAFADNPGMEKNALRALFRTYLDLKDLKCMVPKIFLRTDIWKRITDEGFREASHITRTVTIKWDRTSLLNLMSRRMLKNASLCERYKVNPVTIIASFDLQRETFYRAFPRQVDVGPNKSETIDWMISRTMDGSRLPAPRELIHLLNAARDCQIRKLEMGVLDLDGDNVVSRQAIREAVPEVSQTRLEQTIYAEYPRLRPFIQKLKGEHTLQRPETLQRIWGCEAGEVVRTAEGLADVGFFERRGDKSQPQYWVPFVYRDAAGMVQGTAADED